MCDVKFRSRLLKTDVTAIKKVSGALLVGIGGDLHVFKDHKLSSKHRIFDGENIFGICFSTDRSLLSIHTGLHLKLLVVNEDFTECKERHYMSASDWILDLKWLNGDKIAMVLMNNTIQLLNCEFRTEETYKCEERCILYSGHLHDRFGGTVIFSGTVFNDVLMWRLGGNGEVLKSLKGHKGVIFSIDYNPDLDYLCSTSDDRSAILWKLNRDEKVQVYGHSSRIFRCRVTAINFLTAGEDSVVNVWSFGGELLKRIETHHGGPVWSLDCDDGWIVAGGSGSGVSMHPVGTECPDEALALPDEDGPKLVGALEGGNLVVFSETGQLYHFLSTEGVWSNVRRHEELKSYALLQVSMCRNMVALAGFHGEIFIYQQIHNNLRLKITSQTSRSRIFSLHWLSCRTLLICQKDGLITLLFIRANAIVPVAKFALPPSKERWTTAAVNIGEYVVVGDRRGDVFVYKLGISEPVQVLKRVHTRLGVTRLLKRDGDAVLSMGRDGMVNTFQFDGKLRLVSGNKMRFAWILDCFEGVFAGFSGNSFVLWSNGQLFERRCGGGHRSFDVSADLFVYLKNKTVHIVRFNLNSLLPVDLISGYHAREINALDVIQLCDGRYILISGGEDTTIRTTILKGDLFDTTTVLKSHLSSIRAITSVRIDETYCLVFSAGGRAQVICWKLDLRDAKMRVMDSYYKPLLDPEESEMRIMDMSISGLVLFCACSDGTIKIFNAKESSGIYILDFYKDVPYKLKCLTKITHINDSVLATMSTDGLVNFWHVSDLLAIETHSVPFSSIQSNQSGINSYWIESIDRYLLLSTGGDDNAVSLNLLSCTSNVALVDRFVDVRTHCAQVTGLFMSAGRLITASIDQRIGVFEYEVCDGRITCKFLGKYRTSVTDVQGIKCVDKKGSFDCVVHGNGVEVLEIVA